MIDTSDFPQADKLEQVGEVAIAVSKGKFNDSDIENFIKLDSSGRQGRYYRLAAEIIGLISNAGNIAKLTPIGEEYVKLSNNSSRIDFLGRCLVETKVFNEGLKYIHKHKPDNGKLKSWFTNFYPGAESTAKRRFSTFIKYLYESNLVNKISGVYHVQKYIGGVVKEKKDNKDIYETREPNTSYNGGVVEEEKDNKDIYGRVVNEDYETKKSNAPDNISYNVDGQKRERANKIHWELVVAKSQYLSKLGFQAYENEHIDLYVKNKEIILYEMKSLNQNLTNFISQIRKAISQLYEYQYIFNLPKANLCIVTNSYIPNNYEWYLNYLTKNRNIAYEWTEDFINFNTDYESKKILKDFII